MKERKLRIQPRPSRMVSLRIPADTLESLKRVAGHRDMKYQALMKLYIGQGLRHDLATLYSERVLDVTARVLGRHLRSSKKVSVIVREIRTAAR